MCRKTTIATSVTRGSPGRRCSACLYLSELHFGDFLRHARRMILVTLLRAPTLATGVLFVAMPGHHAIQPLTRSGRGTSIVLICAINSRRYRHYNGNRHTSHTAATACSYLCQPISQALFRSNPHYPASTIGGCNRVSV